MADERRAAKLEEATQIASKVRSLSCVILVFSVIKGLFFHLLGFIYTNMSTCFAKHRENCNLRIDWHIQCVIFVLFIIDLLAACYLRGSAAPKFVVDHINKAIQFAVAYSVQRAVYFCWEVYFIIYCIFLPLFEPNHGNVAIALLVVLMLPILVRSIFQIIVLHYICRLFRFHKRHRRSHNRQYDFQDQDEFAETVQPGALTLHTSQGNRQLRKGGGDL